MSNDCDLTLTDRGLEPGRAVVYSCCGGEVGRTEKAGDAVNATCAKCGRKWTIRRTRAGQA